MLEGSTRNCQSSFSFPKQRVSAWRRPLFYGDSRRFLSFCPFMLSLLLWNDIDDTLKFICTFIAGRFIKIFRALSFRGISHVSKKQFTRLDSIKRCLIMFEILAEIPENRINNLSCKLQNKFFGNSVCSSLNKLIILVDETRMLLSILIMRRN